MSGSGFNLRNLYLYLVCLITLIIFIVSSIQVVDNLMDAVLIETSYYEPYDIYKQRYVNMGQKTDQIETKTEEEIKKEYEDYVEKEKARQRNMNIKRTVSSLFAMIISGGFWLYHWRKIQKEKDI